MKMVSASDLPAGWAYVTNKHSVAIAVDYGLKSGRYKIDVQPRAGPTCDDRHDGRSTTITARGPVRVLSN